MKQPGTSGYQPASHVLSNSIRRRGRKLLHQQCWMWGKDISCPEGNLLRTYGFERLRSPEGKDVSSQYTITLPDAAWRSGRAAGRPATPESPGMPAARGESARIVRLWGYGLFFGKTTTGKQQENERPGIYLNRYEFVAREVWALPEFCYSDHMGTLPRATNLTLLPQAFRWIAEYETWVLNYVGIGYRRLCLCSWSKHGVPAELAPGAWIELSQDLEQSLREHDDAFEGKT